MIDILDSVLFSIATGQEESLQQKKKKKFLQQLPESKESLEDLQKNLMKIC